MEAYKAWVNIDARWFQITFLLSLLFVGILFRDFPISIATLGVGIGTCLLVQTVAIIFLKLPWSSLLSASISGTSLCLLCRSNSLTWIAIAGVLSIGSKFIFSHRSKHFFNPTNFGLVVAFFLTDSVWVSPAQWGEEIIAISWMALTGIVVVHASWKYDVSLAFLVTYVAMLALRVTYLGQPWAVFFHQLNSGALILFTFFMISDPRSTPDHFFARVLFGILVAVLAYVLRFSYYLPQSLLVALFVASPVTLILDQLWKAARFQWRPVSLQTGVT